MKLNLLNKIFLNIDDLNDFLIENFILKEFKEFPDFRLDMCLKSSLNKRISDVLNEHAYWSSIINPKVCILQFSHCIYVLMCDVNHKQVNRFYNLANSTLFAFKSRLRCAYESYIEKIIFI